MSEIVIGKFTLESLTNGMYSDPKSIFREYIQNATDSIDNAVEANLISKEMGEIRVVIDSKNRSISIKDNGTGIPASKVFNTLSDVGNSEKDYTKDRGFRGIGRLAGLAYADTLYFITSYKGEPTKTIMRWDCKEMKRLLSPSNSEIDDIVGVISAISSVESDVEDKDSHYFEVKLEGVTSSSNPDHNLLDENLIKHYLSRVAPVDFDSQRFRQAREINNYFENKGFRIPCYKIFFGHRKLPLYKPYSQSLGASVGRERQKTKDLVRDIDYIYEEDENGKPLYIGWLAITDFSGQISDPQVRGILLRKSNILIGTSTTFDSFFPSEGNVANKMFAGEIYILSPDVIPNSQRDDFEPNERYTELHNKLSAWAGSINKKYRRGTSQVSSAKRRIEQANERQEKLEQGLKEGAISSDSKRQEYLEELAKIKKDREQGEKALKKALERGDIESERVEPTKRIVAESKKASSQIAQLESKIINAEYATKGDLPTSYSREERKLYQRIITVIDDYFKDRPEVSEALRKKIIQELSVKKK